jgi:hypothetical protein
MAVAGLRFEDRLDGASNFVPWKARVTLLLMENGLWDFANTIVTPSTDPKNLATHELKDVKSRQIILDAMKEDHQRYDEDHLWMSRYDDPQNHFQAKIFSTSVFDQNSKASQSLIRMWYFCKYHKNPNQFCSNHHFIQPSSTCLPMKWHLLFMFVISSNPSSSTTIILTFSLRILMHFHLHVFFSPDKF